MAAPRENINISTSPAVLNCHFLHDEAIEKGGRARPRPLNVDALEDVRILGDLSSDLALHGESLWFFDGTKSQARSWWAARGVERLGVAFGRALHGSKALLWRLALSRSKTVPGYDAVRPTLGNAISSHQSSRNTGRCYVTVDLPMAAL